MKGMTLEKVAAACGGTLYGSADDREAAGAVIDSRLVEPGYLFFAVPGENVDGHSFIGQVFEKGALGVICEKLPEEMAGPCILVENSLKALQDIAAYYRSCIDTTIVGITGSVGKTSTKEFIAAVLSEKYNVVKTIKNYNNEIGLPLMVLRIRDEHDVAVLEMGINHFGEMHRLSRIAKPDICVMTNIGDCHLEFLGTRDGILKAKSEIFDFMNPEGFVYVNGDDDKLSTVKEVYGKAPISFGMNDTCDYRAEDIEDLGLFGSLATLCYENTKLRAEIILPGRHMVYNALAAAAIAKHLGLNDDEILQGLLAVKPTVGRSNIIQMEDKILIDDCYNANPTSMKAALELLASAKERKVAILGDMFELGAKEKELHAGVGEAAAVVNLDLLLCVGNLSKSMAEGYAQKTDRPCEWFATKEEMITALPKLLKKGDAILIKASHGMGFAEVVDTIKDMPL